MSRYVVCTDPETIAAHFSAAGRKAVQFQDSLGRWESTVNAAYNFTDTSQNFPRQDVKDGRYRMVLPDFAPGEKLYTPEDVDNARSADWFVEFYFVSSWGSPPEWLSQSTSLGHLPDPHAALRSERRIAPLPPESPSNEMAGFPKPFAHLDNPEVPGHAVYRRRDLPIGWWYRSGAGFIEVRSFSGDAWRIVEAKPAPIPKPKKITIELDEEDAMQFVSYYDAARTPVGKAIKEALL